MNNLKELLLKNLKMTTVLTKEELDLVIDSFEKPSVT